jgi:hypothetical protein
MMLRKGPTADVGIAIGKVCFSEVTMSDGLAPPPPALS